MKTVSGVGRPKVRARRRRLDSTAFRRRAGRFLGALVRWVVLVSFAYIYVFPVIFMVTTSVMSQAEMNNPTINWISRNPSLEEYRQAAETLNYLTSLRISVFTSVAAALGQTLVGCIVAYGFARMSFPGRRLLFGFLLFAIVVPPQLIVIPQFMLYSRLKWMNSYAPLIVPAFLANGLRGDILLVVLHQFFRGLPHELEDAAYVDGAGPFRTFWQVMLPLAKPAILVVFLFSMVWTWNDDVVTGMVLRELEMLTLPLRMNQFLERALSAQVAVWFVRETTFMAGLTLTVLPLLLFYIFAQRYFTQSIDRTGLVE